MFHSDSAPQGMKRLERLKRLKRRKRPFCREAASAARQRVFDQIIDVIEVHIIDARENFKNSRRL